MERKKHQHISYSPQQSLELGRRLKALFDKFGYSLQKVSEETGQTEAYYNHYLLGHINQKASWKRLVDNLVFLEITYIEIIEIFQDIEQFEPFVEKVLPYNIEVIENHPNLFIRKYANQWAAKIGIDGKWTKLDNFEDVLGYISEQNTVQKSESDKIGLNRTESDTCI